MKHRIPIVSFFTGALLSPALLAQTHTIPGTIPGGAFGTSVHAAGDFDADGFDDVIVGAPLASGAGLMNGGAASVHSGKTGLPLAQWTGGYVAGVFGTSVSTAGDFDQDGFSDVIVGSPFAPANGALSGLVDVFRGPSGAVAASFVGMAGDQLGNSVSCAGDVDADGFPDLILGARKANGVAVDSGAASVVSGQSGSVIHVLAGLATGDEFGWAVSGAGDVNADGFDDVIVGAHGVDGVGADSGAATIFSGQTGLALAAVSGMAADDRFGGSVSGAGDVDGDGFDDVVIGAARHDGGGADAGGAWVYSVATGGFVRSWFGAAPGDWFGASVSDAGDVDRDGRPDVIVGAPFSDAAIADVGAATVLSGADGSVRASYFGVASNDHFGSAVGGNFDADADGYPDVIVGAPHYNVTFGEGLARIEFECLGAPLAYGAGCPGSGGFVPTFTVTGCPKAGGTLTATITGGLGGSLAVILFGQAPASIPLPGGCSLSIAPVSPIALPVLLGGSGPGNGSLVAAGVVPPGTPSLSAVLQAYVIDPGASLGATLTNAVSVVIP